MKHTCFRISDLFDIALREKYKQYFVNDPLAFMNFLDYPDLLPDAKTIWYFRERLSKTGKDRLVFNEIRDRIMEKHIRIKKGTMQDA